MFQIDPAACVLAVIALIFAWQVERRNTMAFVALLEIKGGGGWHAGENGDNGFEELSVRIRNIGIALHQPVVWLAFRDEGTKRIAFRRLTQIPADHDEFARGMVAEFALKSYELDDLATSWLAELKDPYLQKARLVVTAQGFDAAVIPLGRRGDRLRTIWNSLAFRVNRFFWRERRFKDGSPAIEMPDWVPMFEIRAEKVMYFVGALSRRAERK